MIRKIIIQKIGGIHIAKGLKNSLVSDIEFYLRVLKCGKCYGIDIPLVQYRKHETNASSNNKQLEYDLLHTVKGRYTSGLLSSLDFLIIACKKTFSGAIFFDKILFYSLMKRIIIILFPIKILHGLLALKYIDYARKKIFQNAITKLPKTKKYTISYIYYMYIEQFFIFLNRCYPFYRKNVEHIEQGNLSHENIKSNLYIPESFFYKKKQLGISGVARLKNGDEFLQDALESYIPFLDELILVDNHSTDNTVEICNAFVNKYPNKVKFYTYTPEIYGVGSGNTKAHTDIHTLAYYYNWSFSKTSYSHVLKIDDDNIAIPSQYDKIIKRVLAENKTGLYATRGLNIFQKNNELGIYGNYPYPGKYGDHGIYQITPKTYYIQNGDTENLHYPYKRNTYDFAFLHLKAMKKEFGNSNISDTLLRKKICSEAENSTLVSLNAMVPEKSYDEVRNILHNIFLNIHVKN